MTLRAAVAAAMLPLALPVVAAAAPSVRVTGGDVQYIGADGAARTLSTGGGFSDPVIGPDGRTVAFIHDDGPPLEAGDDDRTSLWIGDGLTGQAHRVTGPHPATSGQHVFESFGGPRFSLDGGYVYVSAQEWATSPAVHQVSVATGQERFVIDGGVERVIRTGPWRGYLLVWRHMYWPAPRDGSYDPVFVVRPDGKQSFMVPGSDKDDGGPSVALWLTKNGWQAW